LKNWIIEKIQKCTWPNFILCKKKSLIYKSTLLSVSLVISNIKFENYHDIHGEKNQFNTIKRLVADTNFDNDLDHVQKKLNALKWVF